MSGLVHGRHIASILALMSFARASLVVVLLPLLGCGNDPVPVIEITELLPATIVPGDDGADDVRVRLHYIDGDGDLGGGSAELFDCRHDGAPYQLVIPPVASDEVIEKGIEIDGVLFLFLNDIEIVPRVTPSSCAAFGFAALMPGQLAYCMRVRDAAGNESNAACSPLASIVEP